MSSNRELPMAEYIKSWRKRLSKEEQIRATREKNARKAASECAKILEEEFGVSRVYLFGSLARKGFFDKRSDIDLMVEGLDPRDYFRALGELAERVGYEVNLVPSEDCSLRFRKNVQKEGILLYGTTARKNSKAPTPKG